MKVALYSVHDVKADAFDRPFPATNDAVAVRMFMSACQDANSLMHQHPGDYALYCLGQFDDYSGELESGTRRHVIEASTFFNQSEES